MGERQKLRRLAPTIFLATALLAGCGDDPPQAPPAKAVEVVTVQPQPFALTVELPGRIEPVRTAEVRARVAGIVQKREFQEGADVKAGQVLFRIDPAPFRNALSRAQSELAKAEAALFDARSVVERYQPLVEIEAVSRQDFDTAQATFKSAQAARSSAQADVDTAKLDLDYATVTAPISGRIGRAAVTEGALVGKDEATRLATIQQIDPVYADFMQPVGDVLRLRKSVEQGGGATKDGAARISIAIDGTDQRREGKLLFSDISVDPGTGEVLLRGEFPNKDGLLLPGMYVRVTTGQGVDPAAIFVPQRAVKRSTDGKPQVLVLNGDTVEAKLVKTGAMRGADWHIPEGLKAGDRVIVGGPAVNPGDKATVAAPAQAAPAADQRGQ